MIIDMVYYVKLLEYILMFVFICWIFEGRGKEGEKRRKEGERGKGGEWRKEKKRRGEMEEMLFFFLLDVYWLVLNGFWEYNLVFI